MTEIVKRSPLRVAITERGQLDSLKNSTLVNNVEGSTTIISIVPEGTLVEAPVVADIAGEVIAVSDLEESLQYIAIQSTDGKQVEHQVEPGKYTEVLVKVGDVVEVGEILAGDVVCELDSSILVDKEQKQQIQVTQSEADQEKSEKNVEIQIAQNESDIAAAELQRDLAQLDLRKFKDGEFLQQMDEINGEITSFTEDLTRATENFLFSKRLAKKGYKSQNDLEADRIAVLKAEIKLSVEQGKLKVLKDYTYERTIKELQENAEESVRELARVRLAGTAALKQYKAEYDARKLTYLSESRQLDRLRRQIKACKLVAPQPGEVIYAKPSSRRSDSTVIEEGATVRERQSIIKLPDLTQIKVDARIHESRISMVKKNLEVLVRIDAYPNELFHGTVDSVSSVPVAGEWWRGNLKEYLAEVRLVDDVEKISKLKPGLTAEIEIVVAHRENVLQVPVQSVVTIGPKQYSFILSEGKTSRREVLIGETNEKMIEVLDGLAEGEKVVLNPRTHFSDELIELESQLNEKLEQDELRNGKEKASIRNANADEIGNKKKSNASAGQKTAQHEGEEKSGPGQSRNPEAFLKRLDSNLDGKLSKDELPSQMQKHFTLLDANGDGAIDANELKKIGSIFGKGQRPGGGNPPGGVGE